MLFLQKNKVDKLLNSQIVTVLLWGPYIEYDYDTWENNKIERIHTFERSLGMQLPNKQQYDKNR